MIRFCCWVFGCSALLMASPAFAEKPAKPTLVVATLKARGTSAQDAAVLGDMLRSRIINIGNYQVVTPEEMQAIDAELQRQISGGCDEASCISELAGALGAQFLITGSLDRIGSQTVVTLKMIEIERVRAIGSVMARAPNIDGILSQIEAMLGKLFKVKWRVEPATTKPDSIAQPTPPKAPSSKVEAKSETVASQARKTSMSFGVIMIDLTNTYSDLLPGLKFRVGRPNAWGLVVEAGYQQVMEAGAEDGYYSEYPLVAIGAGRNVYQLGPVDFAVDAMIGNYLLHYEPDQAESAPIKARFLARLGQTFPFEFGLTTYIDDHLNILLGADASLGIRW